jgi:hypothetical protein
MMTITAPTGYGGCSCETALGNGGFMAFGILYPLTATATALPAADATDGHGYARADRATAAAFGADGATTPPPHPPKNTRKQITAL